MNKNTISLFFLGSLITACSDDFKESLDSSFKTSFKESFIESCSEADTSDQELRALCVCTGTKAVEQLTVAELTASVTDNTQIMEKILPQCT